MNFTPTNGWVPVPRHPDYEIHPTGLVRSWIGKGRSTRRAADPVLLKPTMMASGLYFRVNRPFVGQVAFNLAGAMLEAFVRDPEDGERPHFLDGDPSNVSLNNLEWRQARRTALRPDQVQVIRLAHAQGVPVESLASASRVLPRVIEKLVAA